MEKSRDLIIIGGGAAGLAAALYASRYKLDVIILAKEFGGTGNIAHRVDNWIGEPGIGGWDLMQKFIKHVEEYQVPMIMGTVTDVRKQGEGFTVITEDGAEHPTKLVLFSNGMIHRKLNVPGEEQYAGKGVHYCYTCDGPLYRNKILAVVGGSDSAALGSLFLSEYATKVYTVFRREAMTAEPVSVDHVKRNEKIEMIPKASVAEIVGTNGRVSELKLDNGRTLTVDGVFIEVGHIPLNDLAKKLGVAVDEHGFIKVNPRQETSIAGILAAGDITNATTLKQFITSAAEGSIAAQTAYHTINQLHGSTEALR